MNRCLKLGLAAIVILSMLFPPSIMAASNQRAALVIGNGAYKTSPLRNPVNDAHDMAALLKELGFEVIALTDADRRQMETAINKLGRKLRSGGTGLFFFAGHGVQVAGINYLIPVDAHIETEGDVKFEAVNANRVLSKMQDAGNPLNMVFLDACRNNPFARMFRSAQQGLAPMDAPKGSLVAFATAPGDTAADGTGRNGVFTKHLLKYMPQPGLEVGLMMRRVRAGVEAETGDKQTPFELSSLTGSFYFNARAGATATGPQGSLDKSVGTDHAGSPGKPAGGLDALLAMARQKEAERQEALEQEKARKQEVRADIGKYRELVASPQGDALKDAAWEALRTKYPNLTAGLAMGDIDGLAQKFLSAGNLWKDPAIGMEFVYIAPGTFTMGSPSGEPGRDDDETQHRVTLTRGYYLQATEVTQGQWKAVMGSNPSRFKNCGDDCPVEQVSWNDVQGFIRKLNQKEGGEKYRLPTEAEWEYAARAGSDTAFANGGITEQKCGYDPNLDDMGWYCGNSTVNYSGCVDTSKWGGPTCAGTHPVARKKPNSWGLYDMHGNVWEWCQDWKGNYPSGSVTDPTGPSAGSGRVGRGGSWGNYARLCRSANRYSSDPGVRINFLGFRLLRTP